MMSFFSPTGLVGGTFGCIFAIEKTKNPDAGVAVLLAATCFIGRMLSRLLVQLPGFRSGISLIMSAFAGTGAIFLFVTALTLVGKGVLSGTGKFLLVGAIMVLVTEIDNIFSQSSSLVQTLSVLTVGIFAAFILHDLNRVSDNSENNEISATIGVYRASSTSFSQCSPSP